LYPAAWLKMFMVSRCFLWSFSQCLRCKTVLSANRDSLTSSFLICIPFISSSCLIILAWNSKSMLNKSAESANLVSFLVLEKCFQFFSIKYDVGYKLVLRFIKPFLMKGCWFFPKSFTISIELIKWFLFLLLLICCITFNYLHMLNHPYTTGMTLTWPWYMIFLISCWIRFAIILLRTFASMST
jgi:hypothetical protein